jgi:hypothetical protein
MADMDRIIIQFDEETLRDFFAMNAPVPEKWRIDSEQAHDKSRNPYNEGHKPKLRSVTEVVADLAYEYADIMMKARKPPASLPDVPSMPRHAKWCQPGDKQDEQYFLIRFDDQDRGDAVFTDWDAARDFYVRATTSWNCWLFAAVPASAVRPAAPANAKGEE